ncbi:MAG: MBL fold metallo-hydrolase [Anaerolineaceae bacterium]|jgi:L-ascorbate metabolism protein UlaG (beta-lactamase superfamily)|nr:MBL fold metallo-hydrolase [Anaerolineaceae bacterium]
MEIIWYGHSCFKLNERGLATVICDPYDKQATGHAPLSVTGEIVTISHNKPGHNHVVAIKGDPFVISGPGEYEIGGVFITGLLTNAHNTPFEWDERNTMFVYDFDGIKVAHLGGINRVPNQSEVEEVGNVHIMLVPIGGNSSLNAVQAAEIVNLIEPSIVIPMHYMTESSIIKLDPLNKFLKEMGLSNVEPLDSFKVSSTRNLPEETQVVVLDALNK